MTTIIATKTKILSDGMITVGDRVDALNFKKICKIDGHLIGGAGRLSSILTFFRWYSEKLRCERAREEIPELSIDIAPQQNDEEFIALVVHPDGTIYIHEGNDPSRSYRIGDVDYYAVGSGSDFALSALDAGATPESAMEVAKFRDTHSGGETFVEELDEADLILTEEDIDKLSSEEMRNLLKYGSLDAPTEDVNNVQAEG